MTKRRPELEAYRLINTDAEGGTSAMIVHKKMLWVGEYDDQTLVMIESRKLADDDYRVSLCADSCISQSHEYSEEDAERQFNELVQMVHVLAKGRKITEAKYAYTEMHHASGKGWTA